MKAATLAVGTEVTDGQILDRNSAWISAQLVAVGIEVTEHRVVPDDHVAIAAALKDLARQVDLLFVTGGLGPTSDDFTRELIATVFRAPLEFDEGSWQHIEKRFQARGLTAKPIQRQQCYFPHGALILENPAGTANAFWLDTSENQKKLQVIALPGPPLEIAAVWEKHLSQRLNALIPEGERETLHIWRTLGVGESEIAERTEATIAGEGLRVGYRAHLPYVEVKLWVKNLEAARARRSIEAVEKVLSPWLVSKGSTDFADSFLEAARAGKRIRVIDQATGGIFQSRLHERIKDLKIAENPISGCLLLETSLLGVGSLAAGGGGVNAFPSDLDVDIALLSDENAKVWRLTVKKALLPVLELEVGPTPLYNFGTERGLRYLTERAFHLLHQQGVLDW